MSRKFYIETTTAGQPRFVKLKRSRSHGHRHHHHHHDHDHDHHRHHHHEYDYYREYYTVPVEEWNILKERERVLYDENKTLRSSLSASQAETQRLEQCVIPDLQAQNNALYADNQSLRRSIDNATEQAAKRNAEMEKLQEKVDRLEKENQKTREENEDLQFRNRHLKHIVDQSCPRRGIEMPGELEHLRDRVRHWKCRFEDLDRHFHDLRKTLEMRTERMEAYEEILKRRRII